MSTMYNNFTEQTQYGDNIYKQKQIVRENKEKEKYNKIAVMIEEAKERNKLATSSYTDFKERTLHEFLSTALNSIYMTALSETMMFTNNTKLIASTMVDKYIEEHGGAQEILDKMRGKTYLLDTIREAVEEEAEEVENEVEPENPETHDIPDEEDKKENILNKLENEDDVESAVNIIAQRITSAEEEFIKKNAEDKQKIEDLMRGMNDRLQAAKRDPNVSEEEEQEIEQEAQVEFKRQANSIHGERNKSVFESFIEKLSTSVVNDDSKGIKELYFSESGQLDIESIVEAGKCLYGFLEFVNTIQLENVNNQYIEEVLANL